MSFKWTHRDEAELERLLLKLARLKRKKMLYERLNNKYPSKYVSTSRRKLNATYGNEELP